MRSLGKRVALGFGVILGAFFLYCAVTIAEGSFRARRIVEDHLRERRASILRPGDLSGEQLRILLAVEDPKFFSHLGVDLSTPGAGMTTITQGLVKFLYFHQFRPGLAKIRQSLLALGFDARTQKSTQLTVFLTSGYMGTYRGKEVRGFREAAAAYFAKSFEDLTRADYLALVAMCVGPNEFSVAVRPSQNARRVARIERLLAGQCSPGGWRDVYYAACD